MEFALIFVTCRTGIETKSDSKSIDVHQCCEIWIHQTARYCLVSNFWVSYCLKVEITLFDKLHLLYRLYNICGVGQEKRANVLIEKMLRYVIIFFKAMRMCAESEKDVLRTTENDLKCKDLISSVSSGFLPSFICMSLFPLYLFVCCMFVSSHRKCGHAHAVFA